MGRRKAQQPIESLATRTSTGREMTYLEALDEVDCNLVSCFAAEVAHRHICVQLAQSWEGSCSTGLSNIVGAQEELEGSIRFCPKANLFSHARTCELRSLMVTGSGSKIVTDLTPARTTSLAV